MAIVLQMEKESKLGTTGEREVWLEQQKVGPSAAAGPGSAEAGSPVEEMVQVFMVVRCYSCKTFQVHQVKKTNRWVCKICTEKQSVIKVYGKGTGKACRKHVQKLNMLQGEREKKEESGGGNHPPCDYANTFTAQSAGPARPRETQVKHPVVLADTKKSKWTAYIDPPKDEEEDCEDYGKFTTDKDGFTQASKARRKARRSMSERTSHPLPAHNQEEVCPYSSVNLQMESTLDDLRSAKSTYFHPNRYTKLDEPEMEQHSRSMLDLPSASSTSPANHKEWMSEIKKDLDQFSQERGTKQPNAAEEGTRIPQLSSRWSQFMCESDSEEELDGPSQQESTTHILADRSTIAKFTL